MKQLSVFKYCFTNIENHFQFSLYIWTVGSDPTFLYHHSTKKSPKTNHEDLHVTKRKKSCNLAQSIIFTLQLILYGLN